MTSAVEENPGQLSNNNAEMDSDQEDDPGKMLNVWLGQLQKVSYIFSGDFVIDLQQSN